MYAHKRVKTAWYCCLDIIPKDKLGIMQYLDFLKLGHFDIELGGLDSPTTNQRLYEIEHQGDGNFWQHDITKKLSKQQV
jgi:anaerobic ribonucleoside-triphosphate reductase activating protein